MTKYAINTCVFSLIKISFFLISYDFEFRMSFDEIKKNISTKQFEKKSWKKNDKNDDIHEMNLKTRENEFTTRAKISKTIR